MFIYFWPWKLIISEKSLNAKSRPIKKKSKNTLYTGQRFEYIFHLILFQIYFRSLIDRS